MNDLAFTVMDLHYHDYPDLAACLLNEYLERTQDYGGLRVLRFYMVYRAMVRAKIAGIRACQPGVGEEDAGRARVTFERYVNLATRLCARPRGAVVLMHGLAGSGKTTVAGELLELLGGVRLRSDVIRKSLHGYGPAARSRSGLGEGLYAREASDRTYAEMAARASTIVEAGFVAIVDATFLDAGERRRFRELAAAAHVPFAIVDCLAPEAVLRSRVAAREREGLDASEAGAAVLDAQIAASHPLDAAEREARIACDTTIPNAAALVAELLAGQLSRSAAGT
jgi:predicted kinase